MKKLIRRLGVVLTALIVGVGSASAQTDVTSQYLTNADFSSSTGWTMTTTGGSWAFDTDKKVAEAYAGYWSHDMSGYAIKQTITLPKGVYKLTGYAFYRSGEAHNTDNNTSRATIVVGNVSREVITLGSPSRSSYPDNVSQASTAFYTDHDYLNTVYFTVDADDTDVVVGYEGTHTATKGWFICGAMKLYKIDINTVSSSSPMDIAVINPGFDVCIHGWKHTAEVWSNNVANNQQGAFTGNFYENWDGAAKINKMYQSINGIPNGSYQLGIAAFVNTLASPNESQYVYANNDKKYLTTGSPTAYEVSTNVTNNQIEFGLEQTVATANWLGIDNITLQCKGIQISYADMLPSPTVANKWYDYGVIPTADEYEVTSSAAATIFYTQDGTSLASSATGTSVAFTAGEKKNINLSTGHLYLKTSAATTVTISYKYNVGSATSSHSYVQGGETVTISFAATTNDPNATFSKNENPSVTFGGEPVTITETTNGFTFTVPSDLTAGTDYTLSIPANAFGYAAGSTYNAAQTITIKTPALFDGSYYLRTDDYKYLSRGASWGAHAIVDEFGEMVTFATDKDNKTSIRFFDSQAYLKKESTNVYDMYTDAGNADYWYVTLNNGKYRLSHYETPDKFVRLENSILYRDGTTNIVDWTLEDYEARTTRVSAYPNNNIQSVITASGAETTVANFETYLGTLTATDLTNKISTAKFSGSVGDWSWVEPNNRNGGQPAYGTNYIEVYEETGTLSQTITGLSAGIYKVTVDAFERIGSSDNSKRVAESSTSDIMLAYLEANGMKTRLTQWNDVHTAAVAAEKSSADNYPNGPADGVSCFNEGYCTNTVYAYVGNDGELTIKLVKPSYIASNWLLANNFTLTLYSADLWPSLQAALQTYAPYDDVAAADDATGYTIQYNIFADYKQQSTSQSDMQAAITYMQNNYANYQWENASIAHPVDVTEGIITDADCTSNLNWDIGLTGRPTESAQDETGTTRVLFYQNAEPDAVRGQTVTIPNTGAYMLKTWVRNFNNNANTYAKIAISNGAYNGAGTYANREDEAVIYGNESTAWTQLTNYFGITTANQQKTIYINLSHGGEGRKSYVSRMRLYYIGQNADFVKDGVHKYIGNYSTAPTIELTDAVPVANTTAATMSNASVTFTNPNGLVFVASDGQTSAAKNEVIGTTCANLDLQDGHPFVNPTQFTATNATYTLSSAASDGGASKFATVMVPFAVSSMPTGVTAYALNQSVPISTDEIRGTTTSIAANSPVLVATTIATNSPAGTYAGSGTVPAVAADATFTNGNLVGTYTAKTAPAGSYVMQVHETRLAFYLVGSTQPTVNPFRAYLQSSSGAKSLTVVFDDVNGIEGLTPNPSPIGEGRVYSVGGARQNNLKKGVNIVRMSDGSVRKVIVK